MNEIGRDDAVVIDECARRTYLTITSILGQKETSPCSVTMFSPISYTPYPSQQPSISISVSMHVLCLAPFLVKPQGSQALRFVER